MLLLPTVGGAGESAAGVQIQYVSSQLIIRVTQPTDLRTVLEEVCQRTQAQCTIAEQAAQVPVAPASLSGTWAEVISELLEGSGLNYASLDPGPSTPGRLLVQARRPATEESGAGQDNRRASRSGDAAEIDRHGEALPRGSDTPTAASDDGEKTKSEPPPTGNNAASGALSDRAASGGLAGGAIETADEGRPSPEQVRQSEASIRTLYLTPAPTSLQNVTALPIIGGNGQPIPANNQPITIFPQPGANGQPIPYPTGSAAPSTGHWWPFVGMGSPK